MKSIWKKFLVILLVSLLIGGASPAAGWLAVIAAAEPPGGNCGADGSNLTWSLDTETGVLTVSGTGDMADYNDESNTPPWADYKDSIRSAVIGNGVTSIGDMAFFLCQSLTDVTIGPDVARIGNQAFTLSCVAEVYVPRSVREIGPVAFGALQFTQSGDVIPIIRRIDVDPANTDYSSIDGVLYNKEQTTLIEYPGGDPATAFTVPDDVTEIGAMAFAYAMYLQNITLPDSLATIGMSAFNYCVSLKDVVIPGSVTTIDTQAFLGCNSIESVAFESGVTAIPDSLFAQSGNLRTVTLPDSVAVIGAHAFAECENLADLTLGSGLETIGQNAFYGCESLPALTISSGVSSIGAHAFYGCTALTSLTFNAVNCADMSNAFLDCGNIQTLVIGNGVRNIPAGAFAGLENVAAVVIPDSAATIGAQAFLSCRSLADVTIGSGVTAIGDAAFQNCESLAQLHIPAAVTSIGAGAFENCLNLAFICSDSNAAYARTYAEANGIEFRLCSGHGGAGEPNTVSGECGAQGGNVTWELDLDTYALTIRGSGAMADYTSGAVWESYRASISTVAIEDGVTRVGSYDFREFASLTSVTIADSVTEIGTAAFEGCAALTSVTLGNDLASIGDRAFKDTGLSSVFLPRSVSQIGADALSCGLNTEGVFAPTLAQIDTAGDNEFFSAQDGVLYNKDKTALILYPAANPRASFAVPDSVTAIGGSAFRGCTGLAEVTIPAGVTEIGDYAFAGCTALESFACPNGLTVINEGVFSGCTALKNAALRNGVTAIGKQAFEACAGLTTIEIPDSVRSIGESAFSACENLTAIVGGSGVGSIGRLAFAGTGLTSVVIPETVMRIEGSTFAGCRSLTSIHIPFTVISISESALADCDNLSFICSDTADCYARTYAQTNGIDFRLCTGHDNSAVTISGTCGAEGDNVLWALNLGSGRMILSGSGDIADYAASAAPWADHLNSIQTIDILSGVTSVGDNAFAGCVPLQSVTIGEDVARIGAGAFASSALTSVAVPARVAEIGADAFACGILTEDGFVPTLERIDVEPENAVFFSANGVLFNRSRTVLIQYPAAADGSLYEIPGTVKRIESGAFRGSRNLTTVHVPDSVTQIGADAFADCGILAYLCCDIAGSFAEAYASDNGMDFRYCDGHRFASRVAGDANGDGSVNMKDVILIRRYLAGGWDNVVIYGSSADVDADGSITLQDVTLISRYLAGGWNVVLR